MLAQGIGYAASLLLNQGAKDLGHHFYTINASEVTTAIANDGRVLEGIACFVFAVPQFLNELMTVLKNGFEFDI